MRPNASEYSPYYGRYIDLVRDEDAMQALETGLARSLEMYSGISEEHAGFRYAKEKWSLQQVLGHVIDTERVFAYRALRYGRNDPAVLTDMDQDLIMSGASFDRVPLRQLCAELQAVRSSTIHLFEHMPPEAWLRSGKVGESGYLSVRSLAFIIAGHEMHHREIVRERYLPALK